MSGIAGIITLEKTIEVSEQYFNTFFECIMVNSCKERIVQKIDHFGYVGVGDLEGRIPKVFQSAEKRITILVWGDFFLKNVKRSYENKYELVLKYWEQHKERFIENITGYYVLFIYDRDLGSCLINSKFGMMQLYYSIKGNLLYFSSRLQSFLDLYSFNATLNKNAVLQYLIFSYSIDNSTYIKDVYLLPAASTISSRNAYWEIRKYDDHSWLFNKPIYNHVEGKNIVGESLKNSILRISATDYPLGCAITGGWDGRLILSYLKNLSNVDFFLYTYGKENHIDMKVAKKLAYEFNYEHIPIILNQKFIDEYVTLANDSMLLSGGARAANRGHYLLMAKILSERSRLVISGNCGSNILKIIQSSSSVYNEYVIKLFKDDIELKDALKEIYNIFFERNPWINRFIAFDEFLDSIINSEIIKQKSISSGYRFYHFLLTNIERKYFGAETAAYSSFIYNYSPFIDSEFVEAIVKTPYFGGHYPFLERNPIVRSQLSKLYAQLMVANDPKLAKFTSDRGFPITWFLTPQGRLAGFLKKKLLTRLINKPEQDPFNHYYGLTKLIRVWNQSNEFFNFTKHDSFDDTFIKAISWNQWFLKYFTK